MDRSAPITALAALAALAVACDLPRQVSRRPDLPAPPSPIAPGAAPAIDQVAPESGPAAGGTLVALTGSNFRVGATVAFGVVPAQVRSVSPTAILAVAPPSIPGATDVRVFNPDGSSATRAQAFTYVGDAPRMPAKGGGCRPAPYRRPPGCAAPRTVFTARAAAGARVQLAGSFTDWGRAPIPLRDDGAPPDAAANDGVFVAEVPLAEGRYEYKFIVDGGWTADPSAPQEPIFGNSVLEVDDPCTPNLGAPSPAFAERVGSADVALSALYADGSARKGPHPDHLLACVDGRPAPLRYDAASRRIGLRLRLPEGEHRFEIHARDGAGFAARPVGGFFVVDAVAEPPVADAGGTRFARAGDVVVIDGSASHDPDGAGIARWTWSVLQVPAGSAVSLAPSHDSAFEGYGFDPAAEPPKSGSRQSFTAPAAGRYLFRIAVADASGRADDDTVEVIALPPRTGTAPRPRLAVSADGGRATVVASAPGATGFEWIEDLDNPQFVGPPPGERLELPAGLKDGVYRFHLVVRGGGQASDPATAQVRVSGGRVARADDFNLAPPWLRTAAIYEVFVRRFADSDGDGVGDLTGLSGKLDYLKDLGVDTLWLMPIHASADRDHGYHTVDYDRVEPDYGTNGDLADLVAAAHARKMRVVLDLALNHTSRRHPAFLAAFAGAASPLRSWFLWFANAGAQPYDKYGYGRELGGSRLKLSDGWADIPDINYGNPDARRYFFGVARRLLDPNGDGDPSDGVDGFRLDHVTGPEHFVWASLRRDLKALNPDALLLAEVFRDFDNGGQGYGIKDYYAGEFDAAFTFPCYWDLEAIFTQSDDVRRVDATLAQMASKFPPGASHAFFAMNHDVPVRTTNVVAYGAGDAAAGAGKLRAAHALQVLLPNTPQFFYGEELAMDTYRGRMPFERDDGRHPVKEELKALLRLRRTRPALTDPEGFVRLAVPDPYPRSVFAFARVQKSDRIVAAVNARSDPASFSVDLSSAVPAGVARAVDLLSGEATPLSGRTLAVSLGAYQTRVYALEP